MKLVKPNWVTHDGLLYLVVYPYVVLNELNLQTFPNIF